MKSVLLRLKLENLGISPADWTWRIVDAAAMQQAQVAELGDMDPELEAAIAEWKRLRNTAAYYLSLRFSYTTAMLVTISNYNK